MTAPTRIGRYELISRMGKSMTDVYLAIDTVAHRKAAVKLIPTDGGAATRLVLEAERRGAAIQKQLHDVDPRMVEIYEYGDLDGYFFVAMQFVEGRSLAEVLTSDRVLEPARAAVIALEICEQLAKFHTSEAAVVHGDVKPSNIHLGLHDTVRLLDFGIAKILRAGCDATMHNFGSPGYCSPERLIYNQVDQQSDLWALGATLYEMLAGAPPYQADSTRKLESLIRSKRPPRALPSACPAGLRAITAKALAPEAAQRYRSARQFQADLQAYLEGKRTLAEMECRTRWNPTSTLETARRALRRVTRTAVPPGAPRSLRLAVAGAWFTAGMALWIGGSLAWQKWHAKPLAAAMPIARNLPAPLSRPPALGITPESLARWYTADGAHILEAYRMSEDPTLSRFDWQKAEISLARAVQLGATGDGTRGSLSLARGYAALERLQGTADSDDAATQQRLAARDEFLSAARRLPADPAPHLALARIYTYSLPDPDLAMQHFASAEKLGATLGPREIEQEGDAFRIRAQQAPPSAWRQALRDAATASEYYQRIPEFGQVDAHLRELAKIHAPSPRKANPRRYARWR